jgi:hypothetical protein
LVFQILLCIQLEKDDFKWTEVLAPIYIFEAIYWIKRLLSSRYVDFLEAKESGLEGALFGLGYIGFIIKKLFVPIQRFLFLLLLSFQLSASDEKRWSWWIVSIPIYIVIVWKFIMKIADDNAMLNQTEDREERSQKRTVAISTTICTLLFYLFLFTFVLLVVLLLDGASFKAAIAFIPIFILLGLLWCCICCCVPILCRTITNPPDDTESLSANESKPEVPWWERTSEDDYDDDDGVSPKDVTLDTSNITSSYQNVD